MRELLQNADDAEANCVEIAYETSQPVDITGDKISKLLDIQYDRLLVLNDGRDFDESDWARLKRIAEGNPDEQKIGAFGVGFFSVFSTCEEPFIVSGTKAMAFHWKSDQLLVRRNNLHSRQATTFYLNNRNPTEMPIMVATTHISFT